MPNSTDGSAEYPSVEPAKKEASCGQDALLDCLDFMEEALNFEDAQYIFLDRLKWAFEEPNDIKHIVELDRLIRPLAQAFAAYAHSIREQPETPEIHVNLMADLAVYAEERRTLEYSQIATCIEHRELQYGWGRTKADIVILYADADLLEAEQQKAALLASLSDWFSICIKIELEHMLQHVPGR